MTGLCRRLGRVQWRDVCAGRACPHEQCALTTKGPFVSHAASPRIPRRVASHTNVWGVSVPLAFKFSRNPTQHAHADLSATTYTASFKKNMS